MVRELMEETGVRAQCQSLMGALERRGPDHHFVILDYRMCLLGVEELVAGDDAAEVAWVPVAEVAELSLVDGLAAFLADHGVIAGV